MPLDDTVPVPESTHRGDKISPAELSNHSFGDRPQWSTGAVSILVGTDTDTLQEAVDLIPVLPYHKVEIEIPSGFDASTEDVIIPQIHLGKGEIDERGYEHKVSIVGDTVTPSNCPVGSLVVAGVTGGVVSVDGIEFQHNNPYDDEASPFAAYYSNQVRLKDCAFAGGSNGVKSYGRSNVSLFGVDFGTNVLTDNAIGVKHGGRVQANAGNPSIEGTVGGHALTPRQGIIAIDSSVSNLTGNEGFIDKQNSPMGIVIDADKTADVVTRYRGHVQFEEVTQEKTLTRVEATVSQTIASASMTKVAFDTVAENESASFDDTNDEIDIPTAGRYRVKGIVKWISDAGWSTGDRASVRIVENAGKASEAYPVDPVQRKVGTGEESMEVSTTRNFAAGDTLGLQVYQDSGASKDLLGSASNNFLEVVREG